MAAFNRITRYRSSQTINQITPYRSSQTINQITHYRSSQTILLVGEGDFSFSLCLARAFGNGANMVATSLDSRESLQRKYRDALRNLTELRRLRCTIVHEVDVHSMFQHSLLQHRKFDRIIFNFPHAGFHGRESDDHQIDLHQILVRGFLHSARYLLSANGEIHITHKTSYPFTKWNLKMLADDEDLKLADKVDFHMHLYPGYNCKRGDGPQCDFSYPVGRSSTFMFAEPYYY